MMYYYTLATNCQHCSRRLSERGSVICEGHFGFVQSNGLLMDTPRSELVLFDSCPIMKCNYCGHHLLYNVERKQQGARRQNVYYEDEEEIV